VARLSLPALAHGPAESGHSGIREIANQALLTPGAIRLDVGQPHFRTPAHIGDAGKQAIDDGKTYYTHTQGFLSLREKLVTKLERVNGIKVTPDRIACTPGGAGVIPPAPGCPNSRMILPCTHARGVFYPCRPADGFQPDLDALASLITPR